MTSYGNLSKDDQVQVLSSDISYIRTGEGFDYLCQIRDVKTNTVLASYQSETMKAVFEHIEVYYNRQRVTFLHPPHEPQYFANNMGLAGYDGFHGTVLRYEFDMVPVFV